MGHPNQVLKEVMAAAEKLPVKQQQELAVQLLAKSADTENSLVLYLKRLPSQMQMRLKELMDKNNEGLISKTEKEELRSLNEEVSQIMLDNSIALARTLRPELFDKHGRPITSRIERELKERSANLKARKKRKIEK